MILHSEYLTDEELELLISETEDDLIPAPPEMADRIMGLMREAPQLKEVEAVSEAKREPGQSKKISKKREFAAYCFRVAMSVAAAIAFMCIVPNLPGFDEYGVEPKVQEYADKEAYLKENGSEPRQEVYTTYPTREEVLNDKSIMQRLLDGENIFDGSLEVPEDSKAPEEPGDTTGNVPTIENGNINKMSYKYESGGQLL